MVRKLIKIVLGLVLLLAVLVFVVLPMVANTEKGKQQLAKLLSNALDREVTIEGLEVGWFLSPVDIEGLRVKNPDGFGEGYMIDAAKLHMETSIRKLVAGTIRGALAGHGVTIHVIRKEGKTNFDGIGGKKRKKDEPDKEKGEIPDLDLALDLRDGRFILEDRDKNDRLEVSGVGTKMRFTNMGGIKTADLTITVDAIDNKAMQVRDLILDSELAGDDLVVKEVAAILPGKGRLGGHGRMQLRKGGGWSANLQLRTVTISGDMMPFLGAVFPIASAAQGQIDGVLDGEFVIRGSGLTWEKIKPSLAGTGEVRIADLGLPADSVVGQVTALAGGKADGLTFNAAGAQFRIATGWLHFNRLSASGNQARYDLAGKVSLDGDMKLTLDLLPLVKAFGGRSNYEKVAQYVKRIPVRIEGTTTSPRLKAPSVAELAQGVGEDGLRKGLGKIFGK